MGQPCDRYWEKRNAYNVLVGNPNERGLPTRLKRRKEDNIKIALKFVIRAWTGSIWLRVV
jgi:hypothetical protein